MHAILIAIGSAGDVFPFIGLARTLKLRGHRVSLCTIPVFRDAVEQHGIAFVPLSDELTYRRTMGDPRLWDPKTSFGVLWQAIAGMIEPVYEYVSAQRHDDIVVVGSLWALGARIAHEKYGIPYLSAQVSPSTLLSAHLPPVHPKFNVPEQMPLAMRKLLWRCIERFKLDRTCAPEINAVRRKVGLETPVKRIFTQWMHSPQGVVCLFPAWFAPPQQDWPQPLHMTGFPLFDGSIPGTPLDDELQRFLDQGSRPLVFTQARPNTCRATSTPWPCARWNASARVGSSSPAPARNRCAACRTTCCSAPTRHWEPCCHRAPGWSIRAVSAP